MMIQVELLGVLADEMNVASPLELPPQTTVQHLITTLGLSSHAGISVSVNNRIVRDWQQLLHDGDRVVIVPPAIGG